MLLTSGAARAHLIGWRPLGPDLGLAAGRMLLVLAVLVCVGRRNLGVGAGWPTSGRQAWAALQMARWPGRPGSMLAGRKGARARNGPLACAPGATMGG